MRTLFVVAIGLASIGVVAGTGPALTKTVSYQATDSATLKRQCGETNGTYGEHTDKAGNHYYWCSGSVNGTIKCKNNVCTATTPDRKSVPAGGVAAGNSNTRKLGSDVRAPVAGKSAGANAASGVVSGSTNAGAVATTTPPAKLPPPGAGAFGGATPTPPSLVGNKPRSPGNAGNATGMSGSAGAPAVIGSSTTRKLQ